MPSRSMARSRFIGGMDGRWSKKEKSPMRFTSRGSSVGDDLLSRGAVSSAEKA